MTPLYVLLTANPKNALVEGPTTTKEAALGPWVAGDLKHLAVQFCQDGAVVDLSGRVQLAVGIPGNPTLYGYVDMAADTANHRWTGDLNLNTTQLLAALAGLQNIGVVVEVQVSNGSNIDTYLQKGLTILQQTILDVPAVPVPEDTYLTASQVQGLINALPNAETKASAAALAAEIANRAAAVTALQAAVAAEQARAQAAENLKVTIELLNDEIARAQDAEAQLAAASNVYTKATSDARYAQLSNITSLQAALDIVTAALTALNSGKANTSHVHDAGQITSGILDIARIPAAALERLIVVANQAGRYALTTDQAQVGDTVLQSDTGQMFFVVNSNALGSDAGYQVYTAGTASATPWSGLTSKPQVIADIAAVTGADGDVLQRVSGSWVNRTMAQLWSALGLGTVATKAVDTDGALAANSDANIPTQKAVRTLVDAKAPIASPAFTGTVQAPTLQTTAVQQGTKTAPAISAGTLTLDLSAGELFIVANTAAITTLSITNPPASGKAFGFLLGLVANGTGYTQAWGVSVKWSGGTAPTLTTTNGKMDMIAMVSHDGGTTYYAYVVGQNS